MSDSTALGACVTPPDTSWVDEHCWLTADQWIKQEANCAPASRSAGFARKIGSATLLDSTFVKGVEIELKKGWKETSNQRSPDPEVMYTVYSSGMFFVWYYLKAHRTNQGWTCNCCCQSHLSKAKATRKMIFTSNNSSSLNFWLKPNAKVSLCFHKVLSVIALNMYTYVYVYIFYTVYIYNANAASWTDAEQPSNLFQKIPSTCCHLA